MSQSRMRLKYARRKPLGVHFRNWYAPLLLSHCLLRVDGNHWLRLSYFLSMAANWRSFLRKPDPLRAKSSLRSLVSVHYTVLDPSSITVSHFSHLLHSLNPPPWWHGCPSEEFPSADDLTRSGYDEPPSNRSDLSHGCFYFYCCTFSLSVDSSLFRLASQAYFVFHQLVGHGGVLSNPPWSPDRLTWRDIRSRDQQRDKESSGFCVHGISQGGKKW